MVGLARLLVMYFVGINIAWPDYWKSNDVLKTSLFGKTNGVAVMFAILHDLIVEAGGVESLGIELIRQKWALAPRDLISNPPPRWVQGLSGRSYRQNASCNVWGKLRSAS